MTYQIYFDRIRINTVIPKKILKKMIDTKELLQHCHRVEIGHTYKLAKYHGYKGRIELFQATDEAIFILQKYCLERHTISRIEISRDRICKNSLVANKLRSVFQRMYYLKWGKGGFPIGDTQYIGKEEGKKRGLYVVCYVPPICKAKLGNEHVVHVEFVLTGKESIKEKLGINTIYDIGKAEDYFNLLADKYLVKATLNFKRINKHFPNIDVKFINEFIEFIAEKKEQIRNLKCKHDILFTICDRKMRNMFILKRKFEYSREQSLILNQGVGYWVNKG